MQNVVGYKKIKTLKMNDTDLEKNFNDSIINVDKIKDEGLKNILKYFDRLHDKLFTVNNILIAGYFALSKMDNSFSKYFIIIPFINLAFLIFLEYKMMSLSIFESNIYNNTFEEIKKNSKRINSINLHSLIMIITTSIVLIFFIFYILN